MSNPNGPIIKPSDDPLLTRFKSKPQPAATNADDPPKQRRVTGQRFAMITEERLKLLVEARIGTAAWAIYHYLLMVNWKGLHQPVKLTNKVLAELSISRYDKRRGLPQLERAGLVKVTRAGRQAPIATPLK